MTAAKLRTRLPYDGQGLAAPTDARFARLRARGAARFWRRVPWVLRGPAIMAARIGWVAAAYWRVQAFLRAAEIDDRAARRLLGDCLATGAQPDEAHVWREVFGGPHPLPRRSARLVLASLGEPRAHRRMVDREATDALLAHGGLATPLTHAIVRQGGIVDLSRVPSGPLFVRPRHSLGGRHSFAIDSADAARAAALARDDDFLMQEHLRTDARLSDLAAGGAAPVLHLTTAREPGSPPFLYSAFLAVPVPNEPRDFRRSHLRVPIDPMSGVLREGLWFAEPGRRFTHAWWNGAPLVNRRVTGFAEAVAAARRAMGLLPGLALASWEVIVAPRGPVILGGDAGGDWILTCLGADPGPLVDLLERWSDWSDAKSP
jgi:hypothetical protein